MDAKQCFLAHHGILGQKWGRKNGPPYPLDAKDHSASEKKAGWRKSLAASKTFQYPRTQKEATKLYKKLYKYYKFDEYKEDLAKLKRLKEDKTYDGRDKYNDDEDKLITKILDEKGLTPFINEGYDGHVDYMRDAVSEYLDMLS